MSQPGIGNYLMGEYVYQGYSFNTATATAKVISWTNGVLKLTDVNGNFVSSQPIIGQKTNANYNFVSYNISSPTLPFKYVTLTTVPVPNTQSALANNMYIYQTYVQEGNSAPTVILGGSNNQIVYVPPAPPMPDYTDYWHYPDIDLQQ